MKGNYIKALGVFTLILIAVSMVYGSVGADVTLGATITAPVVSAINNYQGKYEKKLFASLMNELEVFSDIKLHKHVKSKLNLTKLSVGDGARPYAGGDEQLEGDDLVYTGTALEVDLFQRDFAIEIKRFKGTWMEEHTPTAEGSGSKQKTLPFAAWTTDQILKKLAQELNDKTAWWGFDKADADAFAAEATYEPGDYITFTTNNVKNYYKCLDDTTAGQSPATHAAKWQKVNAEAITPGFAYRIQELISAGKITPETIGEIDNDNVHAYAAHQELFRSHTDAYRRHPITHFCSWDQYYLLLDDIESIVGKYKENDPSWKRGRGIVLPKTDGKCVVLPCTWMSGTERIISTPKYNLLGGTDLLSDLNTIATRQATNYVAVSSISGQIGFAIRDPEAMRINDRA